MVRHNAGVILMGGIFQKFIILSVILIRVIMLSVILVIVTMCNVILLCSFVCGQSVTLLSVTSLNVVTPERQVRSRGRFPDYESSFRIFCPQLPVSAFCISGD